jgi:hypothetical protein
MPAHDRVLALSLQLAQAHEELLEQIHQLGAGRGALVTHCLAFCAALTSHHRGEDEGLFAELLRERPDLAGTVAKLVEDHELIASIVARVRELADGGSPEAVRGELDGLVAIMESHFDYEERAIGAALDGGVPDTGWSDLVFKFRDRFRYGGGGLGERSGTVPPDSARIRDSSATTNGSVSKSQEPPSQ